MATTEDNRVFVDTNVLLAATDRDREKHFDALSFLDEGLRGKYRLFVTGQIFREYLVVATRPTNSNGLNLPPEKAVANLFAFQKILQVLAEDEKSSLCLTTLVKDRKLKGKRIHDANVIACMTRHGLRQLKTYNPSDFAGFPDIQLNP